MAFVRNTNATATHVCQVQVIGDGATVGRFWPVDGGGITFGERSENNVVVMAVLSNMFNAVSDNSGHPGNKVLNLTAVNCPNAFDQSDFNASAIGNDGEDRFKGHGKSDPIEKILTNVSCINSGPFGVRTPDLHADGRRHTLKRGDNHVLIKAEGA